MPIGEEVLKQLVEVLTKQELTWSNEASTFQVQAHQASGKSAACKHIRDTVLKLVEDLEELKDKSKIDPGPSLIEVEIEKRASAGDCTYRDRLESGKYVWCGYKKTKRTDFCRKHNKELGL